MSEKDSFPCQVLIRASGGQRDRWKEAAAFEGVTLSGWIRGVLDVRAAELLDCVHPRDRRQVYEWQETCLVCGLRLRDGRVWFVPEVFR